MTTIFSCAEFPLPRTELGGCLRDYRGHAFPVASQISFLPSAVLTWRLVDLNTLTHNLLLNWSSRL